jgi:DnaJ-class molecular chaperone
MDYYSILGVRKDSSPEDIKKSYRKLAMENHPDRTGGDDTKFKQISEAYDNLKDPHKRASYDHQQTAGAGGFNFNTSNFTNPQGNNPFGDIFGHMRNNARGVSPHINLRTTIHLEEVYTGKDVVLSYRLNNGDLERLDINIPKGATNGMNIRFRGYGNHVGANQRGDLVVNIGVNPKKNYQRDRNDIHQDLYVSALDLILGCKQKVETLDNKTINLNIPKGTKEFSKFKISGYGLPDFNSGASGNLIITVIPTITNITDNNVLEALKVVRNNLT